VTDTTGSGYIWASYLPHYSPTSHKWIVKVRQPHLARTGVQPSLGREAGMGNAPR